MKLSFKDWKKVKDHKDHAVFKNEHGHELKVAKGPLSDKMREQMDALPLAEGGPVKRKSPRDDVPEPNREAAAQMQKGAMSGGLKSAGEYWGNLKSGLGMAEGGDVEEKLQVQNPQGSVSYEATSPAPLEDAPAATPSPPGLDIVKRFADTLGPGGAVPTAAPVPVATPPSQAEMNAQMMQAAGQSTQLPPQVAQQLAANTPEAIMQKGVADQIAGVNLQAKAAADLAKAQVASHEQHQRDVQILERARLSERDILENEVRQSMQDIKDFKIDPNRYLASRTTGQKIATAIGLILGGGAAGVLHTDNPLEKFINQQISNDIEAQKAQLGQKETLFSANLKLLGNADDAAKMSRVMMNEQFADKLSMDAARTGSDAAKGIAMQKIGAIRAANAATIQKISDRRTLSKVTEAINKDPSTAQAKIDAVAAISPEAAKDLRGRLVPGMGLANTDKDASELKELKGTVESAKAGIGDLLKINAQPGAWMSPTARSQAQVASKTLIGLLRVPLTGPGAMSEGERALLEDVVANPTKIFSLSSQNKVKLEALSKRLDSNVASAAKARGMTVDPMAMLSPEQKAAAMAARAAPNNPKSKIVLRKLGLE